LHGHHRAGEGCGGDCGCEERFFHVASSFIELTQVLATGYVPGLRISPAVLDELYAVQKA